MQNEQNMVASASITISLSMVLIKKNLISLLPSNRRHYQLSISRHLFRLSILIRDAVEQCGTTMTTLSDNLPQCYETERSLIIGERQEKKPAALVAQLAERRFRKP
jgi:hypothetical protein